MHSEFPHRPTRAEIDLDALAFNMQSVRRFVGENVDCMAVVKANAYGHGAVECSRRLKAENVKWLAVATVEEGIELREAGIGGPILILGGFWQGQAECLLRHDLTPAISTLNQAEQLDAATAGSGTKRNVHIKIDTGMGRIGFRYQDVPEIVDRFVALRNLDIEGLMSHFAVADDLKSDFSQLQLARFAECVDAFREKGIEPRYIDMANSPGAVAIAESRFRLVRLGGVLYGLGGDVLPAGIDTPELRPVMSVRSKIGMIKRIEKGESVGYGRTFTADRDILIATVPIGYHDGYRRALSNRGRMIVRGKYAPVVGLVSMDWTTIDVTEIPEAAVGDEVTIIGSDGDSQILAEDLSRIVDTISYEITCGIGPRVPRIYLGGKN
ncbi:MAG: alanine racemase [Pyrinomonadaceae bacterium]|nr:alanine racemase [Pyrinomonadaceae bacterium]